MFASPLLSCICFCCVWGTRLHGKFAMVERHPLFGRNIHRKELPELLHVVEAAKLLPRGPVWRIAFLIQGEEDISEMEAEMWGSSSDVFALTFRSQRPDAIYFPESLLAEGRNVFLQLRPRRAPSRIAIFVLCHAR